MHLREMVCIFRLVWQMTAFIQFPSPYTCIYGYTLLVYKEIMFDISKLKLCSIDPEYCVLFLVLCHVIEDKCWQQFQAKHGT